MNFLFKFRLRTLLPATIILVSIATASVNGVTGFFLASDSLLQENKNKLVALAESRAQSLMDYLHSIEVDLKVQSTNPAVGKILSGYIQAWDKLGSGQQKLLQDLYIHNNPNKTGEKDKLYDAKHESDYAKHHARYHGWFHQLQQQRDYYDIFLFDTKGNLVYSVFKELDYATNLVSGKWKDSGLGLIFRRALALGKAGDVVFEDFAPYAPSADAPASFIGSPVFSEEGKKIGVLAFQMPIGIINELMNQKAGLGNSGETYIVGQDNLMRSDSRFSEESTILKIEVKGKTVDAGLKGEHGVEIVSDYRGIDVVSAYAPVEFFGVNWVVLAEIDEEEVLQGATTLRNWVLGILVIAAIVSTLIGFGIGGVINKGLSSLVSAMTSLGEGQLDTEIPNYEGANIFGRMSQNITNFRDNLIENKRMAEEREEEKIRQEQRADRLKKLVDSFDNRAKEALESVAAATSKMQMSSEELGQTVEQTNNLATEASSATAQASSNVEAVAAAAEELAHSVQ
ncbi:MAG: cache domain-containing protein, partial [Alphaproteobacteria bacterium]|nr:cache domain-containing protein [Alphaproteobacteria bacterium]